MDKANPTAEGATQAMEPLKMKATLPNSGREIVMAEMTGRQEMDSAVEAGSTDSAEGRLRLVWAQSMRSLYSLDGERFDPSEHTADSFRALFTPKDFGFVVELYMLANRPTEADVATFRQSAKACS
jgi:hypothetical protein